jgi:hypothetical protein
VGAVEETKKKNKKEAAVKFKRKNPRSFWQ